MFEEESVDVSISHLIGCCNGDVLAVDCVVQPVMGLSLRSPQEFFRAVVESEARDLVC